jgi:hypothetical protein
MAVRLLADIRAHLAHTGTPPSVFGKQAAGDGHFIRRVEQGKVPHLRTIDRVYGYMTRHAQPKRRAR